MIFSPPNFHEFPPKIRSIKYIGFLKRDLIGFLGDLYVISRRRVFFVFLCFSLFFLVFVSFSSFFFSVKMGERKYEFMTRINGKVYGLDDFMERHPGGRDMIALGQDRDSTGKKRGKGNVRR